MCEMKGMTMGYEEFEATSSEFIAMNLAIAAIDRWLENSSEDRSGQDVGREIGAMYREIHSVVASVSPDDDDDEEDEDEEDEPSLVGAAV
jgi:hypothetical protein